MRAGFKFLTLVALVGFFPAVRAELVWPQKRLLLEPPAGASDAVGRFEFVNNGREPVRILEVRSGCGCTVTASEKEVIQPGEKGSIRAVFHIGSRQGPQSVAVTVSTSEPEIRNYDLTVEVMIKEFVTVTPRLVFWRVGDDPTTKTLHVTLAPDFRFLGAESASTDFAVKIDSRESGKIQLSVTPRDSWAKRNGTIKIRVAKDQLEPVEIVAAVRVL